MENNLLEQVIDQKFLLEKKINVLEEIHKKRQLGMQLSNNDKIIITQYDSNIKIFEKKYLQEQKQLLINLNKILEEKCDHNWIEDIMDEPFSTRYICYCSKCYLYKKNIKVTE